MTIVESRFEKVLRAKIDESIAKALDFLTQDGVRDYSEYKYYQGYIKAMRDVSETLCAEANSELSGE